MNYINKLHNLLRAKEIWIIGSDPTLDGYPDKFMDNKLGMALHLAYLKYQTEFTYANELDRVSYLSADENSSLMYKQAVNICGFPFYQRTIDESVKYLFDPCYLLNLTPFPPNGNIQDVHNPEGEKALREMAHKARDNSSVTFGGYGTCLHGALFTAILMGVTRINIIGCGFSTIEGKNHFGEAEAEDYVQRPGNPNFSDNAQAERIKATEIILDECEKMGIKTYWYKTYSETPEQQT